MYSKRDYADITMGAEVVSMCDEPCLHLGEGFIFRSRLDNDGRCWEIDGGAGTITVRLSEFLVPTAIAVHQSIQHQLSPRANMAPRRLTVWAVDFGGSNQAESTDRERRLINDFLVSGRTAPKDIQGRSVVKVMDFEFSQQSGVPVQVFPVATSRNTDFIILEVEVKQNWGGERTFFFPNAYFYTSLTAKLMSQSASSCGSFADELQRERPPDDEFAPPAREGIPGRRPDHAARAIVEALFAGYFEHEHSLVPIPRVLTRKCDTCGYPLSLRLASLLPGG
ncbi:hypothetical protein DFH07DRAFT_785175 [Mycena maculata]|uniref:Uncharacterized protein n=1 Tax=Mycena maculata TaxID=230809 RepID=A0AAD7MHA0_9AGAR|nr:hypothetical protein DFH07DRAFT_785175 [Mycena maculata]